MTDKQIMQCKYKFQSIEKFAGKPYCTLFNETCEFINFACDKNCQVYEDYKQLKRKEQECEELKSTNKIYEKGIARLKDEKNNLKKENNNLKETIDGLLNVQYKLANNCLKYTKTLEEIREITEKTLTIVDYKTYFARDNKSFKQEAFKALKQIQEKINEVIDDKSNN